MDGATPLQILTLIISIIGLLFAAISLTWQFVAWRFNGSVIKVELLAGAAGRGGVVSQAIDMFRPDRVAAEGFTEMLFIVRARNVGRIAVDVTHWSVASPKGWAYAMSQYSLNAALPYRLEAGSAVDFYAPMMEVYTVFNAVSETVAPQREIRGCITLGTGAYSVLCRAALKS